MKRYCSVDQHFSRIDVPMQSEGIVGAS